VTGRLLLSVLVVGTVLAVGAAGSRQASSAGTCVPQWRVLARPSETISAVGALSPTDVWVAGWGGTDAKPRGVVAHWDGTRLEAKLVVKGRTFSGLAAVSLADIWVVGDQDVGGRFRGVIEHWNGRRWHRLAPRGVSVLYDIVMQSPASGWAVGATTDGRPLVMHWNGRFWRKRIFFRRGYEGWLSAVAATSARDVWAVGGQGGAGSVNSEDGFVVHRDGRRWSIVPAPGREDPGYEMSDRFDDVAVASPNEAWAVHSAVVRSDLEYWNGRRWRLVRVLGEKIALHGVIAFRHEAWALGRRSGRPFLLHWSGRLWRRANSGLGAKRGDLVSASALSPRMIWAGGAHLLAQYSC
jgi:hypothetical protein